MLLKNYKEVGISGVPSIRLKYRERWHNHELAIINSHANQYVPPESKEIFQSEFESSGTGEFFVATQKQKIAKIVTTQRQKFFVRWYRSTITGLLVGLSATLTFALLQRIRK